MMRTRVLQLSLMAVALAIAACGSKSPTDPSPTAATLPKYITGVTDLAGTNAALRAAAVPQPSGGPSVTATGNTGIVNGGSNQVRLTAVAAFQTVYAFVNGVSDASGYWELRLPAPTTDATLVLAFGREIPSATFNSVYAVATAGGAVGPYASVATRVLAAATGDVQVTASWDAASDVDLHVVDPAGEEIYYGNETSRSGGALDLDSNAGCSIDGLNNENIRWPSGRAPAGSYTVRLDYWSNCNVSSTSYVVTVNNGGSTQTFRGTFTGAGDNGGAGSGRVITTFTRAGTAVGPSLAQQAQEAALRPLLSRTARWKLEQAARPR